MRSGVILERRHELGERGRFMKQLACAVLMVLVSISASGQESRLKGAPDKPLSNEDVLAMVMAGVGESTIIAAIDHAPSESLDTTADSLGRLTKQGVSKSVIDTIVKRAGQRAKTAAASLGLTQAPEMTRPKVSVAGVGTAPYLQTVLDDLMDFLVGRKVLAKDLGGEPTSRSGYLERAASVGVDSLLYITVDMSGEPRYHLKAQCFEPKGKLLWEEEVKCLFCSGGSDAANSLLKKLEKSLEPHIGKPGLPVTEVAK